MCAGPPTRLIEYQKLNFFWKELGLNKFDLGQCSQAWLEDMWTVHIGMGKVQKELRERNSSGKTTTSGFKNKKLEKML